MLPLRAHAALGLLLFLGAAALLGLAIAARQRARIRAAGVALFGVCGAGGNGASFLIYGHQFSALLMTIGFLLASGAYAAALYVTK